MISQQRNDVHDLNDLTKDQNDAHLRFAQVQLTTISNSDFYVSQTSLLEMDGLILRKKKRDRAQFHQKKTGQHSTHELILPITCNICAFQPSNCFPDIFCVDPSSAAVVMPKVCQLKVKSIKRVFAKLKETQITYRNHWF